MNKQQDFQRSSEKKYKVSSWLYGDGYLQNYIDWNDRCSR